METYRDIQRMISAGSLRMVKPCDYRPSHTDKDCAPAEGWRSWVCRRNGSSSENDQPGRPSIEEIGASIFREARRTFVFQWRLKQMIRHELPGERNEE